MGPAEGERFFRESFVAILSGETRTDQSLPVAGRSVRPVEGKEGFRPRRFVQPHLAGAESVCVGALQKWTAKRLG